MIVTGLAGSGKSTFSRALAAKTGLPVVHLDLYFWKPGWVAPSEAEWRVKQYGLLAREAWIADGNYHQTLDLRLARADPSCFSTCPGGCVWAARSCGVSECQASCRRRLFGSTAVAR